MEDASIGRIQMNELIQPKRRDKLVIMGEILQIARTSALKTQIMYKANLSFAQLNEYLKLLTNMSLLRKTTQCEREAYAATAKGLDFLKKQQEMMCFLSSETNCSNNERLLPEDLLIRTRKDGN